MKFNEIVLFGMPNSGKSTVFNGLTKGKAKIGNWHGVTVDVLEGELSKDKRVKVYDLPGVYSLYPVTLEEKTAIEKAVGTRGLIVAVIEAKTLNIALESVFSLIKKNKRVLIAINMVKELTSAQGEIDFKKLKEKLPVPVVYGEFNTKEGITKLYNAIYNYSVEGLNCNGGINYGDIKKCFTPPKYNECFFDKLCLNKFFGALIFISIFLLSFYLAFGNYGIGKPVSSFLHKIITENLKYFTKILFVKISVSDFLTAFVLEGIIDGIGGILVFLPQVIILFIILNLLELTGYMSRVAYLFDDLLKNTGLNGRAVFSLFMGLGCTAVSVLSTNGLESKEVRKRAVLSSGMICCSAKIPALIVIASSVNLTSEFLFILIIYLIGAVLLYFQIKISNKLIKGSRVPLILELSKYRLPRFKDLFNETFKSIKGFAVKICTVILIISCALFLLKSLSLDFKFISSGYKNSFLYYLGSALEWLFYPVNIKDWRVGSAMVSGFFAKEGIASTIISLYDGVLPYSFESVMALTVFFYVYTPCVTALYTVSQTLGVKFSIKFAILQFLEGLILSYITYYALVYKLYFLVVSIIIFLICLAFKIKKKRVKSI